MAKVSAFERDAAAAEKRIASKSGEIEQFRAELGRGVEDQFMPKGTKVTPVQTERTPAGRAQNRAVTPEGSPVDMDVEFRIDFPDETRKKLGLGARNPSSPQSGTIKLDGIEVQGSQFTMLEHKEVETIWESSHFGNDLEQAAHKIDAMINRDVAIASEMPKCAGVTYTSNEPKLVTLINERVALLPRSVRDRLSVAAKVK